MFEGQPLKKRGEKKIKWEAFYCQQQVMISYPVWTQSCTIALEAVLHLFKTTWNIPLALTLRNDQWKQVNVVKDRTSKDGLPVINEEKMKI